jgi:molybdenum cofactor guanylyltransferase
MPSAVDLVRVTLAILAGGESRRMGMPKTSLEIGGRPILEYLLERLRWPGPALLVTAPSRQHPIGYNQFDREVVDAVEGEGPLRGVLTALLHSTTDYVVVCTVDMPAIGIEQLRWIVQRLADSPELDGLMLSRIDGEVRIEPFPFACRKTAATRIEEQLRISKRSVHSLAELPRIAALASPGEWPARVWTNLNSPQDYGAFLESETVI